VAAAAPLPKHSHAVAPILSLADHFRRGHFTHAELDEGLTFGEPFLQGFLSATHRQMALIEVSAQQRVERSLAASKTITRADLPTVIDRTASRDDPWQPRIYRSGSGFVKTYDGLSLAMMCARLTRPASHPILWAIHWRVQSNYKRNPQAITLREFCAATGYARSTVQLALAELEERGMIKVRRGNGRRAASIYELVNHDRWQAPE
jgi:hypothetical protein